MLFYFCKVFHNKWLTLKVLPTPNSDIVISWDLFPSCSFHPYGLQYVSRLVSIIQCSIVLDFTSLNQNYIQSASWPYVILQFWRCCTLCMSILKCWFLTKGIKLTWFVLLEVPGVPLLWGNSVFQSQYQVRHLKIDTLQNATVIVTGRQ